MSNTQTIHGVLVSIFNIGTLITGSAKSGKSELALALISRGHKLVADDAPEFTKKNSVIIGTCPALLRGFMHIRNLGIINIGELFSNKRLKQKSKLELIIHLGASNKRNKSILGTSIPKINLERTIATDLTNITEIAVRNFILQQNGYDAEKMFAKKHQQLINRKRS